MKAAVERLPGLLRRRHLETDICTAWIAELALGIQRGTREPAKLLHRHLKDGREQSEVMKLNMTCQSRFAKSTEFLGLNNPTSAEAHFALYKPDLYITSRFRTRCLLASSSDNYPIHIKLL